MKKHLLFSFFAISAIGANAQITITTADVAVPTKTIYQATDSMPSVSIGSAGTSQIWNMAALGTDKMDTLTFLPYSAAPNSKFSTANLVAKQNSQQAYVYLSNTPGSLTILGNGILTDFGGGPSQVNQVNNPAEVLLYFPANYGNSFSNNYTQKATFYYGIDPGVGVTVDSVRTKSAIKKTSVVDGWGILTTPLGTFSVLRTKETKVTHDTTDLHVPFIGWQNAVIKSADSSATYSWWANSVGFPLVTANMDSTGLFAIQWLQAYPAATGINEYTAAVDVNVFPNPAQNEVNFMVDSKTAKAILIYDITGRKVDAVSITSDISMINTSGYANGAYTYSITGKDNAILSRGKFSVAK